MTGGRPRTAIGTYGEIQVRPVGRKFVAGTRFRDLDGRLRKVFATATSQSGARALLKERLLSRSGYGSGGMLSLGSSFMELVELWLADLDLRELSESTRENYRDDLRLHVQPSFENYILGEITTGRVEWFLKSEARVSYSRAKHSKTLLNLLFHFALRHDAIPRNPLEGTTPLKKPKVAPKALTLLQVAGIRAAAAAWRTGPGVSGPRPDGQVKDLLEVLLGSAMRIGEALALRARDVRDGPKGMTVWVRGTVVLRSGHGAVRQDHPKTEYSIRQIAVPEFAAAVIRRRLSGAGPDRTVFTNRKGAPLSPYNVRRTFREFLELAELEGMGITLRWYRRTGATVIARGAGKDAAAGYLGHSSTVITDAHYIEPDRTVDMTPARLLEQTLRPVAPDTTLLAAEASEDEETLLEDLDGLDGADEDADATKAA